MKAIRSFLYLLAFHTVGSLLILVALVASWIGQEPVIRASRRWALWHRWCAKAFLGVTWQVDGKLDQGQALYVFKHESGYEAIETLALFERPIVVMKQELLELPFWGRASIKHGSIGVQREAGASAMRAMIASAKAAKATGRPIVLFPEGTRVSHGERPELKAGLAGLYKILDLPVIPVALDTGRVWPKGLIKTGGPVRLKVCETIPSGLPRDEIEARVHQAINGLNS